MQAWKKIALGFLLCIFVLVTVVVTRTLLLPTPVASSTKPTTTFDVPINANNVTAHLSKAISFKTISMRKGDTQNRDQFTGLHKFLRKTYPAVFAKLKITTTGPHGLLFIWPGSDPSLQPILLMSHQDVVPIAKGTLNSWHHPPFSGEMANGYIWGRGALDIKSGMIAILEATELLLQKKVQPKRSIYLFFGDNEEIGGQTAASLAKTFQQQGIRFEYVLDEGSAIVNNPLPSIKGPVAFISLAEKGYMDIQLSTTAKGGHSSMPPKHTTIGVISRAITRLEAKPFPAHLTDIQKQMLLTLAPHMAFTNRLVIANLWLFQPVIKNIFARKPNTNAAIRTTTAATIFHAGVKENVLPIKAIANVNFRILPGDTPDYVLETVRKVIDDKNVVLKTGATKTSPSPISRTTSVGYQTIKLVVEQIYDHKILVTPYLTLGATDSRHFIPVANDVYRFMCFEIELSDTKRIHGTNERISTKSFLNMIRFYSLLMQQA